MCRMIRLPSVVRRNREMRRHFLAANARYFCANCAAAMQLTPTTILACAFQGKTGRSAQNLHRETHRVIGVPPRPCPPAEASPSGRGQVSWQTSAGRHAIPPAVPAIARFWGGLCPITWRSDSRGGYFCSLLLAAKVRFSPSSVETMGCHPSCLSLALVKRFPPQLVAVR